MCRSLDGFAGCIRTKKVRQYLTYAKCSTHTRNRIEDSELQRIPGLAECRRFGRSCRPNGVAAAATQNDATIRGGPKR